MRDADCVAFLQWALPRLGLRWGGYRRVRRQVCRRVGRRLRELGLPDAWAYRDYLEVHGDEWRRLDGLCRISISRFYRDRAVFDALRDVVLPRLARRAETRNAPLAVWSAGCASGEEAYTLRAVWDLGLHPRFPGVSLRVIATDADASLVERARRGCYRESSLEDFPREWRDRVFLPVGGGVCIRPRFRSGIHFRTEDLRRRAPHGNFDLILCRNVAFTYFDEPRQCALAARLAARLPPGGALLLGVHESLPEGEVGLRRWEAAPGLYRRVGR